MEKCILIVIPTYNEARNVCALLESVFAAVPLAHVLVVDDTSPDGTAGIVDSLKPKYPRLHLLIRRQKEGLARAYLAGFQWGLGEGFDCLIQMDADLSHSPRYLQQFISKLETSDAVVGCRYVEGGGIEGWGMVRQMISRGGNIYAQNVLGLPYKDLTGGFNGWHSRVLRHIRYETIASRGYAFQVELKYRAHLSGFRIEEIPILFKNRLYGQSKMTGRIVYEAAYRVWQMRLAERPELYTSPVTP